MENGPFIIDLPIKSGEFPYLCEFTGGYHYAPRKKHLNMNPKGDHMLNLLPFKFSIYTIWLFNIAMENHHF